MSLEFWIQIPFPGAQNTIPMRFFNDADPNVRNIFPKL